MRIFYAEDDQLTLKAVVYLLAKMGHEITAVDEGKEAMVVLSEEEFKLIILDLYLPGAGGLEILGYIRKELKLKTPVIILSRNGMEDVAKEAFDQGASDYIVKPFEPKDLLLKIKKFTGEATG